jgi:uncharacterized membrane protein HdeD (DUF308 family)
METMRPAERRAAPAAGLPWWLFLLTGIGWLLIALIVLRFDTTSIATVGTLLGVVLLVAGANEFMIMSMRAIGWRWLHIVLGVLFVIGGVWAFVHPLDAFWELASILGLLLVLKGSMDIVGSIFMREVSELWWLGLVVGILEILLAFWVSQQFFAPRAILIIVWVGFAAMFRGITEIVMAFEVRRVARHVEAAA